jgi:hypothetical protein
MTLPDLPATRKPPSRAWLFGPYVALLIAIVAWSGFWVWARGQVVRQLDAARAATGPGPRVAWSHEHVGGYPFRIEVILDDVRASEPSGWALSAQQVRAETYAYVLKHWVAYAPNGVVLTRPGGAGDVVVTGQAVRASVIVEGPGQAEFAAEGLKLAFAPAPGARPFPLSAVDHIDAHTRPAAGQAGATEFLIQVQGAHLAGASALARVAGGQPLSAAAHGTASDTQGLAALDWPGLARAWSAAGGRIALEDGWITAGPVNLNVKSADLGVGADGRLNGRLTLNLAQAPGNLAAFAKAGVVSPQMAAGGGEIVSARRAADPNAGADLTFQNGTATFGPIAFGRAPRIY